MKSLIQFARVAGLSLLLVLTAQAQRSPRRKAPAPERSAPAPAEAQGPPTVEYFGTGGQTQPPFSEAVRVGPMLYLSGQLGIDATGKLAAGGIGPETRQALENIRAVLERHNSSMDRVVKCTVMLADLKEFGEMNQVYRTFFRNLPARSTFGANGLVLGARVEIECWATVGGAGAAAQRQEPKGNGASAPLYAPVHKYDPARDAEQDTLAALAEARRTGRRVLLEVGGEWCVWCHIMDDYFDKHPDLLAFREKNFVMVKINFSEENKNEQFLSRYPKVAGYPHLFVLDGDGKLLHSQDTGQLEEGRGYNLEKFTAFLKQWSPTAAK